MTRFLNWLGYQLVMWLPYWMACDASTRFGTWCLQRAGGHAFPSTDGRTAT